MISPIVGRQMAAVGTNLSQCRRLTDDAKQKLAGLTLLPGMPVEVHIKTTDRTALAYFAKPISDQFARAFRER